MNLEKAGAALKKYFGYDRFRPLQAEIIEAVLQGRDALVLMPTGGGKSICYQIPAIIVDGTAVVVSPLIALMKDQVEGLLANGVRAALINSTLSASQLKQTEDALLSGLLDILYVSPEKLVSASFQPLLKRIKVSLFAIDEAHCISAWGHDFRQEYTQLKFLKNQFPRVPVIALTATADKLTRKDIVEQLGMKDPAVFISSFNRPNIAIRVKSGQKKLEQILDFLRGQQEQSGIIYCLARKTCEELAAKLLKRGIRAAPYHGDMPAGLRSRVQEDFLADRTQVICATIAFGMGIDKSNVRFVIHYNLPRNVEGYYQEIGRAGRDGLPSEALLFFSYGDVIAYRKMIESSDADEEQQALKIAKLERMYQVAEAPVCRRKTILAYFGETFDQNCGNCDICLSPPRRFDGTIAVQKALSALLRTGESVGLNLLIDILRGSQRQEIRAAQWDKIKTYGAGREYSFEHWSYLISQMLHLGYVEIAYDDHSHLRATEAGRSVLFNGTRVPLALPPDKEAAAPKPESQPASAKQTLRSELFDLLVKWRRQLAQQEGVPPYVIFSDATLQEIAASRPTSDAALLAVSGVGERKLVRYGNEILAVVREFILDKTREGVAIPGSTQLISYTLYCDGMSVEEIAAMREISPVTVTSHLATMYEKGETLDIDQWVEPEELDVIQGALGLFEEPFQLKEIFEHFRSRYHYDKIRWAIADYNRKRSGILS